MTAPIRDRLEADLKAAMRERDTQRTDCIRMLKSKLLEREVELRAKAGRDHRVTDEEALAVLSTYAKQRRDSIESYRAGGREDLAAAEEAELALVESYLPSQLSDEELRGLVREAVSASGAAEVRDLGRVMKALMPKVQGRADGKRVTEIVREILAGAGGR
jgi:uncharacterized protein YqeY